MKEVEGVERAVYRAFEVGKRRDFDALSRIHASDGSLTKFDDSPPYRRQNAQEALMHEELSFASLSDFSYSIEGLKVDLFGEIAIATFHLEYGGVIVDNYTFEGRTAKVRSRGTMVFHRREGEWVIVHEHFSRFPEG